MFNRYSGEACCSSFHLLSMRWKCGHHYEQGAFLHFDSFDTKYYMFCTKLNDFYSKNVNAPKMFFVYKANFSVVNKQPKILKMLCFKHYHSTVVDWNICIRRSVGLALLYDTQVWVCHIVVLWETLTEI